MDPDVPYRYGDEESIDDFQGRAPYPYRRQYESPEASPLAQAHANNHHGPYFVADPFPVRREPLIPREEHADMSPTLKPYPRRSKKSPDRSYIQESMSGTVLPDPDDDSDDEFHDAEFGEEQEEDEFEDEMDEDVDLIDEVDRVAEGDEEGELVSEADSDFDREDTLGVLGYTRDLSGSGGRGRGRGRVRSRGSRGGRGSRSGRLTSSRDSPRTKSTNGRRNMRGIKKGIRKPMDPSVEFKDLHSQATMAFVHGELDMAEDFASQAILENPEMFSAHSLLSEIHMAQGDKPRALTALFHGAHTRPRDTETWIKVAELILDVESDDRQNALLDSIFCYNRVIGADCNHVNARFRRAELNFEAGKKKQSLYDYLQLLKRLPNDLTVLRHLAQGCIAIEETPKAILHYDEAIATFQGQEPGHGTEFSWSDANIYAELFILSKTYGEGLKKVKGVMRWLLGRGDEVFWEKYQEDDAEFDAFSRPRRVDIREFVSSEQALDSYGNGVPLELRVKLGILRLKLGEDHLAEALEHFSWLGPDVMVSTSKVHDYPDLFVEVADALRIQGQYIEAVRFYEPVQQVKELVDRSFLLDLASCQKELKHYDDAELCYQKYIETSADDELEANEELATMFEEAGLPDRAKPYLNLAIQQRKSRPQRRRERQMRARAQADPDVPIDSIEGQDPVVRFDRTGLIARMTARQTVKRPRSHWQSGVNQDTLRPHFIRMKDLYEQYNAGDNKAMQAWMSLARAAIDRFREVRIFYPYDKHIKFYGYSSKQRKRQWLPSFRKRMAVAKANGKANADVILSDSEGDDDEPSPTTYSDVEFSDWLDCFLKYALLLAKTGETKLSYSIAQLAADCAVFYHNKDYMFTIHIIWIMCAMIANDHATICNLGRFFMKENPFVTDSYRLFSVVNRICSKGNTWYNLGPTQKFVLRQIKAIDFSLEPQKHRKSLFDERARGRDEEGNHTQADDMDVALLMLYGHILYSGQSYAYSLNYFYRAHALDPENSMVNLSLALGYIHYALKRQSENRQTLIMQGLSFLFLYRDKRVLSERASERQEAEFNVAKAYHMLGLVHLAIPYYERCLDLSMAVQQQSTDGGFVEDLAKEAAYVLQGIWMSNGQGEKAMEITEKWLRL